MALHHGGIQNQTVSPGGLVSSSITWEKVTQWDLGLDFAILNSRLQGTFDYYQRSTTGMLGAGKVLPNILGTNEPEENAADMVTRGWELSLSWNDRLENGLHYNVSFNLSDTQAEITKFDNPTKSLSSPYYEGQILGISGDMNLRCFSRKPKLTQLPTSHNWMAVSRKCQVTSDSLIKMATMCWTMVKIR